MTSFTGSSTAVAMDFAKIKINGTALTDEQMGLFYSLECDSTLGLPDMAELRFADSARVLMDDTAITVGKTLDIEMSEGTSFSPIFKGEITSIECEFNVDLSVYFVIRAMDKMHRLTRATKTRVFVDSKDSDAVSAIVGEVGLTVEVDATTTVYKHIFQDNQNDFDFLHNLAQRNGFFLFSKMGDVQFKKELPTSPAATLKWGGNLRHFAPRATVAGQVDKVTVKGWNVVQKATIVGVASTSSSHSVIGAFSGSGGKTAQSNISAAERFEVRMGVPTQGDADKMAQGILDDINSSFIEGDGMAVGNSAIRAGVLIKIEEVGTRFAGKYWISHARHTYRAEDGFLTYFRIGGRRAPLIADGTGRTDDNVGRGHLWAGVVTAIVTSNLDSDNNTNMGYVKVKYPWLDDAKESYWARLASPGAGNTRGMAWMPEVNDEVLIAFEAGDFNRPYVIGGLWNGRDALPQNQNVLVVDGKVEVRTFQTRIGHILRFTDTSGSEKIELLDGKGKTTLTMDTANEKVSITSTKDVEIKGAAAGKIDILNDSGMTTVKNSSGGMTVESGSGAITVKSGSGAVTVESSGGTVTVKGVSVTVEATGTMTVKGALVNVEASGVLTLKGSMVKIGP